jgi:hypothetical protein
LLNTRLSLNPPSPSYKTSTTLLISVTIWRSTSMHSYPCQFQFANLTTTCYLLQEYIHTTSFTSIIPQSMMMSLTHLM